MKKLTKKDQTILNRLVRDYNSYSHLVAVNRYRHHEEGTTEWNRGSLNIIRNYLGEFANSRGIELIFTCGVHSHLDTKLEYVTVSVK
nr:MAG TPA: hypothetical protein [Caudoviricetes sp.]